MEGTVIVTLARPDKMHRVEEMAMGGMVGGPTIERTIGAGRHHGVGRHAEPRRHGRRHAHHDGADPDRPGPGGGTMTERNS